MVFGSQKLNFRFHFQIAETGKRLKMLLLEDVKPVVAQIAECLADWYKRAQTIYLKVSTHFMTTFGSYIRSFLSITWISSFLPLKNQILAKDVITCDDALYALREQIDGRKMEAKMADLSRVFEHTTLDWLKAWIHLFLINHF